MNRHPAGTSLTFAALLFALAALAPLLPAGKPDDVYGSWQMMNVERGGVHYEIVMTIEQDRVRMTTRCSHQGNRVEVVVSSAASIGGDRLRITESDQREKEHGPGYLQCRAAIRPMQLGYAIEDGKLVLTDQQRPRPMVLTRIDR